VDRVAYRQVARLAGNLDSLLVRGLVRDLPVNFQAFTLDVHFEGVFVRDSVGQPRHLHLHGLELGLALGDVQCADEMHAAVTGGGRIRRSGRVRQSQRNRTHRAGCHHEPSGAAEKASHECPPALGVFR
jgi:hypothetical protein